MTTWSMGPIGTARRRLTLLGAILALLLAALPGATQPLQAASIIYVDASASGDNNGTSWAHAYTSLQAGLAAADSGMQIWVADGIYTPGSTREASFELKNGVAVYGGFRGGENALDERNPDPATNATVLSGDLNGDDWDKDGDGFAEESRDENSYKVVIGNSIDGSAILDGFTIMGGKDGSGISNENSSPTLTNLIICNNITDGDGAGIYNDNSSPRLTNLVITGNWAWNENGGGIANSESNPILTNVTISGNWASRGGGIANSDSNPILTNVTISGNQADHQGGGIYNYDSNPELQNSIVWGNVASTGNQLYNWQDSHPRLTFSLLEGGLTGPGVVNEDSSSVIDGHNNLASDPQFVAPQPASEAPTTAGNYRLQAGSPAIDQGNKDLNSSLTDCDRAARVINSNIDMGAYEWSNHYYVDASASGSDTGESWANAFRELHRPLRIAGAGTQIWVAAGVYLPGNTRIESFELKNGVAVYGGFSGGESTLDERSLDLATNTTVLSGDLNGDDADTDGDGVADTNRDENSYRVVLANGIDGTAILDGFVITGGNGSNGGGVSNWDSSPTLTNLVITGNTADEDGGGICNENSHPVLTHVLISGNTADNEDGGGISNNSSNPTLTNVTIMANRAYDGGGIANRNSNPTLTDVLISGNHAFAGGGIFNANSNPTLANVTIMLNTAGESGGGMRNHASNPTLAYVSICGNRAAEWGGGIYNDKSKPVLTNVLISDNEADAYGGGIANLNNSNPTLKHVTITGNSTNGHGGGLINELSHPSLTNVIISGNHSSAYGGGIANFESDPILTNVQISGNVAHEFGGGIYNGDSNPKLINVTIAGNRANSGGGIRNYDWSDMELQNSIVWGNTANIGTQILNKEDSDPIIGFSLIEGGLTEPGVVNEDDTSQVDDRNHNLDADPRFVNPVSASNAPASDGNYRLRDNSPALDRGDNTVNDSETDCDGQPRIVNSTIDLGAYEGVAGIATTGTFDPPGGTLELADGHITIPPDALRETTTMTYTDVAAHRSQLPETTSVLRTFTLEGHTGAGLALEQFNQPVSIVFNYPLPSRLAGTAGAQPVMLFWDPYAEQWLVLGPTASCPSCGISVDQQAGTVTAVTIHITEYALVLQDSGGQILYLPIVWR